MSDNGQMSAFPLSYSYETDRDGKTCVITRAYDGLSKREYFAAMAMQGFAADPEVTSDERVVAIAAVRWADALLAALEEK